jgi:hypothetical protein
MLGPMNRRPLDPDQNIAHYVTLYQAVAYRSTPDQGRTMGRFRPVAEGLSGVSRTALADSSGTCYGRGIMAAIDEDLR